MNQHWLQRFEQQTRQLFWKEALAGHHDRALEIFTTSMQLLKTYKRIAAHGNRYPQFKEVV